MPQQFSQFPHFMADDGYYLFPLDYGAAGWQGPVPALPWDNDGSGILPRIMYVDPVQGIALEEMDDNPQFPWSPTPIANSWGLLYSPLSSQIGNDPRLPVGPVSAFADVRQACSYIRDGYGDRVYLKRGRTFTTPIGNFAGSIGGSGCNSHYPVVIGAWGNPSDPRPIVDLLSHTSGNAALRATVQSNLVFESLDVYYRLRNPAETGFNADTVRSAASTGEWAMGVRIGGGGSNVLLQDIRVRHAAYGVHLGTDGENVRQNSVLHRCVVQRSSQLVAATATAMPDSQGLYTPRCSGVRVNECVLDHNGWMVDAGGAVVPGAWAPATNHNFYFHQSSTGLTMTGCVSARAALAGVQVRAGSGNTVENCLALRNPNGIAFGHTQNLFPARHATETTGTPAFYVEPPFINNVCKTNVVMYTKNYHEYNSGAWVARGSGKGIGVGLFHSIEVFDNIVCYGDGGGGYDGNGVPLDLGANDSVGGLEVQGLPAQYSSGGSPTSTNVSVSIHDNIVYDWAQRYPATGDPSNPRGATVVIGKLSGYTPYTVPTELSSNVSIVDNDFQEPRTYSGQHALVLYVGWDQPTDEVNICGGSIGHNNWYSHLDGDNAAVIGEFADTGAVTWLNIRNRTGQPSNISPSQVAYSLVGHPTPRRDITAYMTAQSTSPATLDEFLRLAGENRRGNWNSAWTASAVNSWVRQGFT